MDGLPVPCLSQPVEKTAIHLTLDRLTSHSLCTGVKDQKLLAMAKQRPVKESHLLRGNLHSDSCVRITPEKGPCVFCKATRVILVKRLVRAENAANKTLSQKTPFASMAEHRLRKALIASR